DIASGGRTLIREKTDLFSPLDVRENLVGLMLMLPSANRKTKEVLRMFKDSSGFAEFFPPEDDLEANARLLERIPNLDTFEKQSAFWGKQVKSSLGNTLRTLNPVIILDEGHKAYSDTAQDTLNGFNPSIIVELSATPLEKSNKLVDITGIELNREEMIKFDLHIFNKANPDWKETILEAHNHLEMLKGKAREYHANTGKYIRPICLIQVERTGKEQRGKKFIHAEDVREHLINIVGLTPEEVAVKTSEKDELKEVDDVGGLMSQNCRIRYIITKQALQEGWDCAFAYVLTILTRPGSKTALTQLVGRILRQPFAKKTGLKELDESYVFCYQQKGAELLEEIRHGFRGEGLGDLASRIAMEDEADQQHEEVIAQVRDKFKKAADQVILPVFAIRDGSDWRKVNYEMDIASQIPWDQVDPPTLYNNITLLMHEEKDVEQIATLSEDQREVIRLRQSELLKAGALRLDPVFLARHLLDIVPNPWVAYEFGKTVLNKLLIKNDQKAVINNFVFIIEELRKRLAIEKDRLAEQVFRTMIAQDKMHFLVIANKLGYKLTKQKKTHPPRLNKASGDQLERSLFDYVSRDDFDSDLERQVAWYLDDQDKLLFWYRNVPKSDYDVQGWQKHRVYADFIFTDTSSNGNGFNRVFVVETKGIHLKQSEDTDYKKKLFNLCNERSREMTLTELGLKLPAKQMSFLVIAEDEWQQRLNELFITN
ncbi:MAG: DEAD/DEAH box helicase family protein, partial [Planctomycetota bacterium]|nr:DEAD/DEAH box helicase family protein [Planctomycetota bacterium]